MDLTRTLPYPDFVALTERYMAALSAAFAHKGATTLTERADRRAAWAEFHAVERQLHDEIATYHFLNPSSPQSSEGQK